MVLDDGTAWVTCQHCAKRIAVSDFSRPMSDRVREADQFGPRSYIIVGHNRLIHICELAEDA